MFILEEALSGKEGKGYITIDGKVQEAFWMKSIEATIEKNKEERTSIGSRGTQNRALSFKGTGTMIIYFTTHIFNQLIYDFVKKGKDAYFDVQIINDDPANVDIIGKQTITLRRVNIDSLLISKLVDEDEILEQELPFTFEDYDYIETLKR